MEKLKYFVISLAISFVLSIVLLSLCATLFAYTNINDRYLESFVFGIVALSVLIGSIFLSKKIKEKGLLMGAIFGIIFCFIIYILTVILYRGFFVSATLGIYSAICALTGVIGGIIGVNI